MASEKERTQYNLKKIENIKKAKIAWIVRGHVLMEMFTITDKSALVRKSQIFNQPQPK